MQRHSVQTDRLPQQCKLRPAAHTLDGRHTGHRCLLSNDKLRGATLLSQPVFSDADKSDLYAGTESICNPKDNP
jgi:hypothetical protein